MQKSNHSSLCAFLLTIERIGQYNQYTRIYQFAEGYADCSFSKLIADFHIYARIGKIGDGLVCLGPVCPSKFTTGHTMSRSY